MMGLDDMNELLDILRSLADGVECMGITDSDSGIRWAIAEIKKLQDENERLRNAVRSLLGRHHAEIP